MKASRTPSAADVVTFWVEAGPEKWFTKDAAFDEAIRARFLTLYEKAAAGEREAWAHDPDGALALLLLLDQFPRNMFRGSPRAFATDELARAVAHGAISLGLDRLAPHHLRGFFYLPFEHSESLADQERSVELFEGLGDGEMLKYAMIHRDVIAEFGRFPHRNAVLGRQTTPAEQAFLEGGGFAG